MILALIPARYASTRFPAKPLVDLCGKPMIQRVWEQASKAKGVSRVAVATDDARIAAVVKAFGGEAVMTPVNCASGTDRIAVAARKLKARASDIVVNVQGDEPLLPPRMIEELVALMKRSGAVMGTLCRDLEGRREALSPHCVKAVCGADGFALHFTRAKLERGGELAGGGFVGLHIGIYAYRAEFLQKLAKLKPTPMEKLERLEQLRVLENGFRIAVARTKQRSVAVDTPADAARVRRLLR